MSLNVIYEVANIPRSALTHMQDSAREEIVKIADAAAHAVAKYEKAFDDGADITAREYRKRVDELNKSLDEALKTRRAALTTLTESAPHG